MTNFASLLSLNCSCEAKQNKQAQGVEGVFSLFCLSLSPLKQPDTLLSTKNTITHKSERFCHCSFHYLMPSSLHIGQAFPYLCSIAFCFYLFICIFLFNSCILIYSICSLLLYDFLLISAPPLVLIMLCSASFWFLMLYVLLHSVPQHHLWLVSFPSVPLQQLFLHFPT